MRVLGALGLEEGTEIVTAEDEHPGLLGPLAALARRGVAVRAVPFAELPDAVGPHTGLVACSHVNWVSGEVRPEALAALDVPVLLDGAQGVGAVPVDVAALGCAAYAGSGQKWLCGPDGLGMLWVSPGLRERMTVPGPGYTNLSRPGAGLDAEPWPDGRALDSPSLPPENVAAAVAAHAVLDEEGWPAVHARALELAEQLAAALRAGGREVAPRGPTTLVAFSSPDPEGEIARLVDHGVVVRPLPGRPLLRASVGAWNDGADLERLLTGLAR